VSGTTLWLTEEEADAYFVTRLWASATWLVSGVDKTAALTTAQSDLESCADYDFTDYVAAPTDAMKNAVCEQALFLLQNPEMEERLALRSQGVTAAGIVQETYLDSPNTSVVISPRAIKILGATYAATTGNAFEVVR